MKKWLYYRLEPMILMIASPLIALLFWYTATHLDGSLALLFHVLKRDGFLAITQHIVKPILFGSWTSWSMVGIFALFQYLLIRFLPGNTIEGNKSPTGFTPIYKDNALFAFFITMISYVIASFWLHLFSPTLVYEHLGEIICTLTLLSFAFSLLLYIRGLFAPSSADHKMTRFFLFDYYWGCELHPQLGKRDIKQLLHSRIGMMSWGLLIISFAATQQEIYGLENSMLIALSLQLLYLIKFFAWESGYLRSLQNGQSRAGFHLTWGSLVWVPVLYSSPTLYLVQHPTRLSPLFAFSLLLFGVLSIFMSYLTERQNALFHQSAGNTLIWGKKPLFTKVHYTTRSGEVKEQLLLASGWWGLARHFHYLPEMLSVLAWTLPALFDSLYPYCYLSLLTLLTLSRGRRDDALYRSTYGASWDRHCDLVPYKLIPYIY